jgi:hypothetical protein
MKIFFPLIALFTVTFMVSGCSPPVTPTQSAVPTSPVANVTCNELSFYLDPALGDGFECVTVPESDSSDIPAYYVFIYPAHTELTIQNYPLTHTQFPAQVWIYPVSRFGELLPDILPPRVSDLKRIISNGIRSSGELPFLPVIPQKQAFFIHASGLSFNGGQGVRFITEYSEGPTPITNKNIIYTFQGLTDYGTYWVAVTLPISSPILPADYDTLPEGYTEESLILNYNSYVSDVKDALEAQAPGSFSPTTDSLDSLVKSITIRQ